MANGPLIPGLQEFDGPRRRLPRVVWWLIIGVAVAIAVILLVGLFALQALISRRINGRSLRA